MKKTMIYIPQEVIAKLEAMGVNLAYSTLDTRRVKGELRTYVTCRGVKYVIKGSVVERVK